MDKRTNIYKEPVAEPVFQQTVVSLCNGAYGLFVGHRQAGKTTMAVEIAAALKQQGCRVAYVDLTVLHPCARTAAGVLLLVLKELGVIARPEVSPLEQLQHQVDAGNRLCVVLDEGDRLADLPKHELQELIGHLRSLRNRIPT